MKTYPSPPIVGMTAYIATTASTSSAAEAGFDAAAYVLSQLPSLSDQGLSGYFFVLQSYPNPFDGGKTNVSGIVGIVALQDTQEPDDMAKLWTPIYTHVNAKWPGVVVSPSITVHLSYWDWFQTHHDTSTVGGNAYVGSRLLDGPALTANITATREAFRQFSSSGGIGTAYLVGGKGVWNAKPRGGSDAVVPAWRKAYVHAGKSSNAHSLPLQRRLTCSPS